MIRTKFFIYNIIIWLSTSSKLLTRAEERLNNLQVGLNETRSLNVYPGIKFLLTEDEIIINMRIRDLLQEMEVQSQRSKERKNILQKIGQMMMVTPFIMQMLSLPGAIASIKMSLLRSLMVAQLAIAMMIYNLIRSTQNEEVVVVHQPQHHTHYYHGHYPKDDEDEWFGR